MPSATNKELYDHVPFLPGFRPSKLVLDNRKSQLLGFRGGVRVVKGSESELYQDMMNREDHDPSFAILEHPHLENNANSMKEGEALRFYGHHVKGKDKHEVSVMVFHDNTIQIYEKATSNAGCFQGVILKRGKVPVKIDSKEYLTWKDFNVAGQVVIYGRTYNLERCDNFTREFLTKNGVNVPQDIPKVVIHIDAATAAHAGAVAVTADPAHVAAQAPKGPKPRISPSSRPAKIGNNYFSKDRQVLRFYGVWDETKAVYGELHRFVIHYFLSDDTIEIRQMQTGKIETSSVVFLRRQKLPKKLPSLSMSAQSGSDINLSAKGSSISGEGEKADNTSINIGSNHETCYSENDLGVGKILTAFHRPIYLCDCDHFTREYFKNKSIDMPQGVHVESVIGYDMETGKLNVAKDNNTVYRDTLNNMYLGNPEDYEPSILPVARMPPVVRRRNVSEMDALNCVAKLESEHDLDRQREFTIRMYLKDDTMAIFEKPVVNSGLPAGKYLERRRVKKPGHNGYFGAEDISLGARLTIYGKTFVIEEMDKFSQSWIEKYNQNH